MLLSPAGGQMHIHSFDLVSIKSHLQLILPLHLNTVIANGFRKLCKKGRQQLKLHFGGESLTCARAFSSAVATPCSDSEAAQHPLQREESTETKPFKSKSGRTPNPELADVGHPGTHTERSRRRGHGVGASEAEREQEQHRDEAEDAAAAAPVPALLPLLRHHKIGSVEPPVGDRTFVIGFSPPTLLSILIPS